MAEGDHVRGTSTRIAGRSSARLRLRAGDRDKVSRLSTQREGREKDRSYRIALGSLLVSVVVAIASPLSSWLIARQGIDAASSQSHNTFLLDQKKGAYAEFFSKAIGVTRAQSDLGAVLVTLPIDVTFEARSEILTKKWNESMHVSQDKFEALQASYAAVVMVGADKVTDAAQKVRDHLAGAEVAEPLNSAFLSILNGKDYSKDMEQFGSALQDVYPLLDDYLTKVREDYGQAHGPWRVGF
jgi:hypothetical protein